MRCERVSEREFGFSNPLCKKMPSMDGLFCFFT